jgi:hypothetical protein
LVINKIDLADGVRASLDVMERDSKRMRGERPFMFTNLRTRQGLDEVVPFIETRAAAHLEPCSHQSSAILLCPCPKTAYQCRVDAMKSVFFAQLLRFSDAFISWH